MRKVYVLLLSCVLLLGASGCVGTILGTAADVVVEVVKFPFKVGKGIVSAISDDDEEEEKSEQDDEEE